MAYCHIPGFNQSLWEPKVLVNCDIDRQAEERSTKARDKSSLPMPAGSETRPKAVSGGSSWRRQPSVSNLWQMKGSMDE